MKKRVIRRNKLKIHIARKVKINIYTVFLFLSIIVVIFYFVPFASNLLTAALMFTILCVLYLILLLFSNWKLKQVLLCNLLCGLSAILIFIIRGYAEERVVGVYSLLLIFFPMFTVIFLIQKKEIIKLKVLSYISIIGLTITGITTYLGVLLYPEVARTLAAASESDSLAISISMLMNIGGFDIVYSVVLAIPLYYVIIEQIGCGNLIKKIVKILLLFLVGMFAVKTQYTTALLLVFLNGFLLLLFKRINIKNIVILTLFITLLFEIFNENIVNGLNNMADIIDSQSVSMRLEELADTLQGGAVTGEDITERSRTYTRSLENFIENPLIGNWYTKGESSIGGHSTILDLLASTGILGFFIVMYAVYKTEK